MFKKFTKDEHVSAFNQVKSSVQRGIRAKIGEQYPYLEDNDLLDELIPKKEPMIIAKCQGHMQVVVVNKVPLFFNLRDGAYFPTLRLLHQYPNMMNKVRVDRGAIKFVLNGSHIMCPGLTSPGATLHDSVAEDEPVAIFAEGKELPLALGLTKMSTDDIKNINRGVGVDNIHFLNDGLWKTLELS